MRTIDEIIVHCTATPAGRETTVEEIDRWHRQRGWSGIGYHYVVDLDGVVHDGRPVTRIGAHCRGRNTHTIGVAYVGGLAANGRPYDTRTHEQRIALRGLLQRLVKDFPAIVAISGHRDYAAKACPCFDARAEYADIVQGRMHPDQIGRTLPHEVTRPDRLLMRGDFGEDVFGWQRQLRAYGYDVAVDGDFGPQTEAATRWFQSARAIPIDGVVGPQTEEAMADALQALGA